MISRFLSGVLVTLFSLNAVVVATPANVSRLRGAERRDAGSMCGSEPTPDAVNRMEEAFASVLAQDPGSDGVTVTGFKVPVNFNVIFAGMDISRGYVPLVALPIYLSVCFLDPDHPFQRFPDSEPDRGLEPGLQRNRSQFRAAEYHQNVECGLVRQRRPLY